MRKERKPTKEPDLESFIIKITVGAAVMRLTKDREGLDYRGFICTLRADPGNAGTIYVGKTEVKDNITYPLVADASQDNVYIDIDKLFVYASQASQVLHIWGEKKHGI